MIINPTILSWVAPVENTDGSQVTDELNYNVYVNGVINQSVIGTLRTDDRYEASLVALEPGTHSIYTTAFYAVQPEAESDPSNTVEVLFALVPKVPADLSAEL